jgi:hypothetical protein
MQSALRVALPALVTLFSSVALGTVHAQSIRGVTVDRAGAPVPGVVVLLLDARDSVHSRALTNDGGEFRVAAATAGVFRLRSLRIGFRPTTSAALPLGAGQELTHRLDLVGVPVSLDTVRIVGRNSCRVPTDSAAATFAIWEQVRAALTATQLSAGARGVDATLMTFNRALEPDRERVLYQSAWIVSGLTRSIWKSPTPDSLRRAGYVVEARDGSVTYVGPDLGVLLSPEFIEDHCFRLATARDQRLIGIAFEPTRERNRVAGISGTVWVDRRSAELRRMEFQYVNATREQMFGHAGGQMEFAPVKGGAWVISGWHIRMPVLTLRPTRQSSGAMEMQPQVSEIRVEGGEVVVVTRRGDTLWARPPMPLMGVVSDSATGAKVDSARIVLRGTVLSATTDTGGRFRIPDVLPGQYTVDVHTPALRRFGMVHSVPLTFTDSATPVMVRVPSAAQVIDAVCPVRDAGVAANRRDAMVAGTVRIGDDTLPARDVRVVALWGDYARQAGRTDVRTSVSQTPLGHAAPTPGAVSARGSREARTDVRGSFRLCGLPHDVEIVIRSWTDSSASQPAEVRIATGSRYAAVDLALHPLTAEVGVVSGVVLNELDRQPMPDVEVAIPQIGRSVLSDERGRFHLHDLPAGPRVLVARRLGFMELRDTVAVSTGKTAERTFVLRRVTTLDTVAVTENVVPGLDERRRFSMGRYVTRADLEKLQGRPISSALNQIANVRLVHGRSGQGWLLSSRGPMPGIGTGRPDWMWCPAESDRLRGLTCGCYAQVYLDKSLMNPGRPTEPFDVNTINSQSIEAVEWYAHRTQVPVEYANLSTECGVLVIHSRRSK